MSQLEYAWGVCVCVCVRWFAFVFVRTNANISLQRPTCTVRAFETRLSDHVRGRFAAVIVRRLIDTSYATQSHANSRIESHRVARYNNAGKYAILDFKRNSKNPISESRQPDTIIESECGHCLVPCLVFRIDTENVLNPRRFAHRTLEVLNFLWSHFGYDYFESYLKYFDIQWFVSVRKQPSSDGTSVVLWNTCKIVQDLIHEVLGLAALVSSDISRN